MKKVYEPSLIGIGGAERFTIGQTVKISPFASLMPRQNAVILGSSLQGRGRICVRIQNGLLGHYTPTMLEA